MNESASTTMESEIDFNPFEGGAIERIVATTEAQREVWLGSRLGVEASLAYNETVRLALGGRLEKSALVSALDLLVLRHESLRASFSPDGLQLLVTEPVPLEVDQHDLSAFSAQEQEAHLQAADEGAVREPFVLEQGPLFRASLFRLADDRHVLLMSAHHAICDGWSWSVICSDLGRLYAHARGHGPALQEPQRYSDYSQWEQSEALGSQARVHLDYWVAKYAGGTLPVLELPLDRARRASRTFASARVDHLLERELVDGLRRMGARCGSSLYAVMLAGFSTLLSRLTGQDDLVVGIPAAGQLASEMHGVVGHCVNVLPLRLQMDASQPFETCIAACGTVLLDAAEHQSVTYGSLLRLLPITRDPSRLALVSVLFNVDQDSSAKAPDFDDLSPALSSVPRAFENFELFLNATPVASGLQLEMQFNTDLFDHASIERWLALYEQLLRSAANDAKQVLGRLDWMPASEMARLRALQPAATPQPEAPLMHAAFVRQAAATPGLPALCDNTRSLSYRELDEQSSQLARALRERGIGRGDMVGLCMERGTGMVVALLAVLKSGAAYVPLDPGFPQARLDYYAQDANLALLVSTSDTPARPVQWRPDAQARLMLLDQEDAWRQLPTQSLPPSAADAQPQDPAYVIYTSGSTGKPKGVCVPHRAVANFLRSMQSVPGIGQGDRLAAVTTLSFDIAVAELVLPLGVGAEVIVVPKEVSMDGPRMAALLEERQVDVMQATPSSWRLLLDTPWSAPVRMRAWIGGEPVPPDLARQLLGRSMEVWNLYGPTETTVWSSVWRMDADAIATRGVSIGRPMDNTDIWILDASFQCCPIGVPGEICIGGLGVTLGYHERPELSRERFVDVEVDGQIRHVYRTGDRGRWRNDNLLEHLGRFDFQVKVRGYRIELGEIEARCNEFPGVTASVVVVREDSPGDMRLVAYLESSAPLDRRDIGGHLRQQLPQYMLPQHVVTMARLPLLPNGKVDRKALPAVQAAAAPRTLLAPGSPVEHQVLGIVEDVLHLPGVSMDDDFFSLGGHSLMAAQLIARINGEFGLRLPLGTIFLCPQARQLAQAVDTAVAAAAQEAPSEVPARNDRSRAPLTREQERMRFAQELHPSSTAFNTPSAHRLRGPLNRALFVQALRQVVQRQDALRAHFEEGDSGGWVQRFNPVADFELPFEDLRSIPAGQRQQVLQSRMQASADTPLPWQPAPLWRVALYQTDDEEHVFLFMAHHLIWDGYSFDVLYREMDAAYGALVEQKPNPLAPLKLTYGDHAMWQDAWLSSGEADAQRAYWRKRFAEQPVLRQAGGPNGPAASHAAQPGHLSVQVPTQSVQALREFARGQQMTVNLLVMAAWGIALSRATGDATVALGIPVRGRHLPGLDDVMGMFLGLVPVHAQAPADADVCVLAAALRGTLAESLNHQELPFEQIAPQASLEQRKAGLYQAVYSFQDVRERPRHWGPLAHDMLPLYQRDVTDRLGIWLLDHGEIIDGVVFFNSASLPSATVQVLVEDFLTTLNALTDSRQSPKTQESPMAAGISSATPTSHPMPDAAAAINGLLLPEQAQLAQIWSTVLGIDVNDIRASDNFFDLGGDSLLAMRAVQQSESAFGFRIEARRYVFESLSQLARQQPASQLVNTAPETPPQPMPAIPANNPSLIGKLFSVFSRR